MDEPDFTTRSRMNRVADAMLSDDRVRLRDTFATAAMQGLLAGEADGINQPDADIFARRAYEVADAMLDARKKGDICDNKKGDI